MQRRNALKRDRETGEMEWKTQRRYNDDSRTAASMHYRYTRAMFDDGLEKSKAIRYDCCTLLDVLGLKNKHSHLYQINK